MAYTRAIAMPPRQPTFVEEMPAHQASERAAEEKAWGDGKELREWKQKIAATDAKLPRYVEDVIDALDTATKAKLAAETKAAYDEKKQVREEKPETATVKVR